MNKIFIITSSFLFAALGALLVTKKTRQLRHSDHHIMIPFDQFKARELEKR